MSKITEPVEVNAELKRRAKIVEPGLILIKQIIDVKTSAKGTDVTGPYWTLGFIKIKRGQIFYKSGSSKVPAPGRYFAMFLPPYSIIEVELKGSLTDNYGFTSQVSLPPNLPIVPVVFIPKSTKIPESVEQAVQCLKDASTFHDISRATSPSGTTLRIKKFIQTHYQSNFKIDDIAKKLKTSPAVVSRYFQKDFGLTPVQYRHWLRIMEGMVKLIEGSSVIETAYETGFQTMSQFYEQFEKIAHASPGKYQPKKSKNRKKSAL